MRKRKQAIILARKKNVSLTSPSPDPWAPDDLRDQVRGTFATLCEPDSKQLRQRLLTGLAQAGVDLGSALFILGIPATTFDDLSPSDLGKLLRYIRINSPTMIEALAGLLMELRVVKPEARLSAIDKAASTAALRTLIRPGGKTKKVTRLIHGLSL